MKNRSAQELLDLVNSRLQTLSFPARPQVLYEPIRYELALGGKRIRPIFFFLAAQMFVRDTLDEAAVEQSMPNALALEIFHNYTLLHDDVMDNSPLRRGKPTVFKKWNVNTAILSGDAMLQYACCMLAQYAGAIRDNGLMERFMHMALQVMEGQQYDMNFETRLDVSLDEYSEMIRLKTGVLIAESLFMGARVVGSDEDAKRMYAYGELIGQAFQLQDDYLDVFGDSSVFGKPIGGDIVEGKKTWLLISAFEQASAAQRAEMQKLIAGSGVEPKAKIEYFTDIYRQLGVAEKCRNEISCCYEKANALLDKYPASEACNLLRTFANDMINRTF